MCRTAATAVDTLNKVVNTLADRLKLPHPETREAAESLLKMTHLLLTAPSLAGIQVRAKEWQSRSQDILAALDAGRRVDELHQQYDPWLLPESWQQDVRGIRQAYMVHGPKWYRVLSGEFRRARNSLTGLSRSGLPGGVNEQQAMTEAIMEVQRLQPLLQQYAPFLQWLFGRHYRGPGSDWQTLSRTASWLIALYKEIEDETVLLKLLAFLDGGPDFAALRTLVTAVESELASHERAIAAVVKQLQLFEQLRFGADQTLLGQPLAEQRRLFQEWFANVDQLQDMVVFNHLAVEMDEGGLTPISGVAAGWPEAGQFLTALVRRSRLEALLAEAMKERPVLAAFNTEMQQQRIQRFCQADKLSFQINRTQLAERHWQQLPRQMAGGQLGVLLREFEKKRRHLPIRKLMSEAGHAIQTIKPVFMMSPLSIPMYLPPGAMHFDLVVFDEASQVRPVEAFGAILRGNQCVVVGDSKQLPPTNFFNQMSEVEEEADSPTADLESVLGLFSAQGAPQRMLRWHYRSRHESLITVSNYEFYENKLVVFPSPDAGRSEAGVIFHHLPDTAYDRGRSSTNEEEARIVAEAVMEHARTRPHLTLGVAAFSIKQRQAIQDQVELLRRQNPGLETFFNTHTVEPFFVKNLENVQGDERDVIFISVGYGKTAEGYLSMNFGPLNQNGGERRLNVLITRARLRCEIFTNLTADDIDLSRTQARGVVALKRYLKYAETGNLDVPTASNGEVESLFEEAVLKALQGHGYVVDTQVGSAGFRIDLAVKDKDKPGHYLLGIECDGATYHSARSARDRDRLRQTVLENMGWHIHRIWSTDWFRNPEQELQRTIAAIEAAKAKTAAENRATAAAARPISVVEMAIDRHEDKPAAPLLQAQPYQTATLLIPTQKDLHEFSRSQFIDWVQMVVEVEGPVHIDEVRRRIVDAAQTRLGSRIKAEIDEAIAQAVRTRLIYQRGDFLWGKTMKFRVRSHADTPDFNRRMDQIPPEEVQAAVQRVVGNALGMYRGDIPSAVCSFLGFGRTSEEMRRHIDRLVDHMVATKQLKWRGDYLINN
jgi:very-short-patch-repair endonuclease